MNSQKSKAKNTISGLQRLALSSILAASMVYADDKAVEHFDFQPGQTLNIDFNEGGSVRIESWDQAGIEVEYEDDSFGLDRYEIDFDSSSEGLTVTTGLRDGFNSSGIEFRFKVPENLLVKINSAGGGITLEGLIGSFSGHTAGGNLIIREVIGDLNLRTGGGRILVEDSEVDGRVKTGGGKVLVKNVMGDFDATSGGGEVSFLNFTSASGKAVSPNNRDLDDATSGTVLISNAGGRISVDSAPEGADVYTGGGKIMVKNADRFVAARTGGGDIELDLVEGWVDASTGAGDVEISIGHSTADKGDIKVISGLGDITLTVPANFSMNLEVELGVTNNIKKSFSVRSDFEVETETDLDWNYEYGTPRKVTRGTANVNGGDHKVYIQTVNGNVTIKTAN